MLVDKMSLNVEIRTHLIRRCVETADSMLFSLLLMGADLDGFSRITPTDVVFKCNMNLL